VFGSAAEAIGNTPEALRDELRASGGSIASVAVAHGKTADAVIAAMTADANAHIDQAVANGQMTAEQGAKAKEKAATAIARMVNSEGRPHGHGR
jgi:DNA-binding transcriptional regulator LsrR (DeoR family)